MQSEQKIFGRDMEQLACKLNYINFNFVMIKDDNHITGNLSQLWERQRELELRSRQESKKVDHGRDLNNFKGINFIF